MSILKRVLLLLLLLGIISSCIYGYFYFKRIKTPPGNALNAIPLDASLIIETNNLEETWKKLSHANLIWMDLIKMETFERINTNFYTIDSLIAADKKISEALQNHPVFVSAHKTQNEKIDFLFCTSLPNTIEEESILSFINKSGAVQKNSDNSLITTIHLSNKSVLHFAIVKGILLMSRNSFLIESSIKQLDSGESLTNDSNFKKVRDAAGDKPDAALYINYKKISPLLSPFLNSQEDSKTLNNIAAWTELDLTLKTNEISLSGYTSINDSAKNYLAIFETQQPCEINVTNILPDNTAWFMFNGISDIKAWRERQEKNIESFHANAELDPVLTSWVNEEVTLFSTKNLTNQSLSYYAAFGTNDTLAAIEQLKKIRNSSNDSATSNTITYRGYNILNLPYKNILAPVWGSVFKKIENNFITHIDNYIVFGNSSAELEQLIDNYTRNKTLAFDEYYNDFFNGHLDPESNIYFYASTNHSAELYKSLLNTEYENLFNENDSLIKKIQAAGIQFSFNDNLIYSSVFLKHNPVSKKLANTVWETQLDTTVTSNPQPVINHHTKTKDIFIQDDAHTIYLINSTGQILWKKKLPEKIIGNVNQIDAFNNNKLQLLFNTPSFIYLIDRNGEDVKNFPIKLQSTATAPLTVVDYENDKTYRILVPCSDKSIYNYTTEGEKVKGWEVPHSVDTITLPVFYSSISKMDYIIFIDKSGNVKAVNRHGEERFILNTVLQNTTGNFKIIAGKNIDQTAIIAFDTLEQAIVRLYINGKKENVKPEGVNGNTGFNCYDLNNDKINEYILTNSQTLWAINNDESIVFENNFETDISLQSKIFSVKAKGVYLGVISTSTEDIYVFDSAGNQLKGLPVKGIGGFTVDDINNDGTLFMICIGTSNRLFAYQIE